MKKGYKTYIIWPGVHFKKEMHMIKKKQIKNQSNDLWIVKLWVIFYFLNVFF